jgi:hypothetical protein
MTPRERRHYSARTLAVSGLLGGLTMAVGCAGEGQRTAWQSTNATAPTSAMSTTNYPSGINDHYYGGSRSLGENQALPEQIVPVSTTNYRSGINDQYYSGGRAKSGGGG